jgi:hypothetical protein
MVFADTPEIFSKVVDASQTKVTTAKYKGTDEKHALWNGQPVVTEHFKPV